MFRYIFGALIVLAAFVVLDEHDIGSFLLFLTVGVALIGSDVYQIISKRRK